MSSSGGAGANREETERAFRHVFAALVGQGVPPNVAAAQALAQISGGKGATTVVDRSGSGSSGTSTPPTTVATSSSLSGSSSSGDGSEAADGKKPEAPPVQAAPMEEEQEEGDGEGMMEVLDVGPLTLADLRLRVAAAEDSGDYTPLADWLREGFSSFPTLDRSFLLASSQAIKEAGENEGAMMDQSVVGDGGLGLDLAAAGAFYQAVAEAEAGRRKAHAAKKMRVEDGGGASDSEGEEGGESLLAAVRQGQALLAEHLHAENHAALAAARADKGPGAGAKPARLRPYLILLDNPELADPSYHHSVARHLFAALVLLPNEDKDRLRDWIADASSSQVDAARFNRWLAAIQQYISICVLEEQSERSFRDIKAAVRALALLYKANQKRHGALAPLSEFYNAAVNEEMEREREEEDEEEDDAAANEARNFLHLFHEYDKWRADRARLQRLRREGRTAELQFFEPRSLCFYPFVISPHNKARLLQLDAREQMRAEIEDEMRAAILRGENTIRPYLVLRIDREDVVNSAIASLALYEAYDLKKRLRVQFINEEGVDEGGVQKEFFQIITRKMFDRAYGMFVPSSEEGEGGAGLLYFNPDSFNEREEFELVGVLLGIAVYNSIILDLKFPPVVYKKIMGALVGLEDLEALQPAVAHSMARMLSPTFTDADFEALDQRFELSYEAYGALKTVELKPNGSGIPVTRANVREYVDCYVDWVLSASVKPHFEAFQAGFLKVCGGDAFRLFQPEELELLLCGNPTLDFEALERVALYEDGLDATSPLVRWFWEVVHALDESEKKLFLKFVTGSDRAPINGLGSLQFVISPNGDDSDRLPSAHTCFQHLLIPRYASKEKLADRLKCAIRESEGFGLR